MGQALQLAQLPKHCRVIHLTIRCKPDKWQRQVPQAGLAPQSLWLKVDIHAWTPVTLQAQGGEA
jgi:hypothetical protein